MQKHHVGESSQANSIPASGPEDDHSKKKANMIANLFYVIMVGSIIAAVLALFWLAASFGK